MAKKKVVKKKAGVKTPAKADFEWKTEWFGVNDLIDKRLGYLREARKFNNVIAGSADEDAVRCKSYVEYLSTRINELLMLKASITLSEIQVGDKKFVHTAGMKLTGKWKGAAEWKDVSLAE